MRTSAIGALAMLMAGCGAADRSEEVVSIELRASGLSLSVDANGNGHYPIDAVYRSHQPTPINIGREGFSRLLKRVAPFRAEAGSTEPTSRQFLGSDCPKELPRVTDAGMMSIRWIGPGLDQIYIADFGCDYRRYAGRNGELVAILKSLPVPERAPLA